MFKRRFRLPSPALVISMVALSLVLGGTAIAASSAKHGDKKADTKLVKKLAPSLSVKHAKTADSATNATNATHATSADSATNATNASALGGKPPSAYAATAQPAFIAPTLGAGYSNLGGGFSKAGYAKDTLGYVHLSGTLNCPATTGTAFTLPVGYRPGSFQLATEANNNQANWLTIAADGSVTTNSADGICGLDGVSFPAGGTAGTSAKSRPSSRPSSAGGAVR
jgi:hypothetical protein